MAEYSPKFLAKMKAFGLLKYDFARVVVLVSDEKEPIDVRQFKQDFQNPEHPVFIEYDKGFKSADFAIEKMLLDKAMEGDIDAINKLEELREARSREISVKKLFNE